MKLSACQYSFVKMIEQQGWDIPRFVKECQARGLEACDFHQRLIGKADSTKSKTILDALKAYGLSLSGFSLSNNFATGDAERHRQELAKAIAGMEFGARIGAKVIRFFGAEEHYLWLDAMEKCLPVAEKHDLTIALENHGGRLCCAAEQIRDIEAVNSPRMRALIDIGNYMQAGENPGEAIRKVAKYCVYVHLKDFKKFPADSPEGRWCPRAACNLRGETVGEGDVNLGACLRALAEGGYRGYAALEFEGQGDPLAGIDKSLANIRCVLAERGSDG